MLWTKYGSINTPVSTLKLVQKSLKFYTFGFTMITADLAAVSAMVG